MEKIKIALVGCGYWGKNYVNTLRDVEGFPLAAVCDTNIKVLEELKNKFPHLTVTHSYKTLLDDKDIRGVIVATPASNHYEIARDFLEHGKEVFVEKPLTTKSKEAEELCNLAEKRNSTLMVGHIFKYNPAVNYVKKLLDNGEIGALRYIESRRVGLGPIRQDVSALWDLASHDIYISSYFAGKNPKAVNCSGISHNGKVDDITCVNLKFDGGILATIYANWEHPNKERIMVVGGTKKAVSFDDIEPTDKIRVYEKGVTYQPISGEIGEFLASTRDGAIVLPKIANAAPLKEEIEHFLKCIKKEEKCRTDGIEGLNNVIVLEAAELSRKRKGLEVEIEW